MAYSYFRDAVNKNKNILTGDQISTAWQNEDIKNSGGVEDGSRFKSMDEMNQRRISMGMEPILPTGYEMPKRNPYEYLWHQPTVDPNDPGKIKKVTALDTIDPNNFNLDNIKDDIIWNSNDPAEMSLKQDYLQNYNNRYQNYISEQPTDIATSRKKVLDMYMKYNPKLKEDEDLSDYIDDEEEDILDNISSIDPDFDMEKIKELYNYRQDINEQKKNKVRERLGYLPGEETTSLIGEDGKVQISDFNTHLADKLAEFESKTGKKLVNIIDGKLVYDRDEVNTFVKDLQDYEFDAKVKARNTIWDEASNYNPFQWVYKGCHALGEILGVDEESMLERQRSGESTGLAKGWLSAIGNFILDDLPSELSSITDKGLYGMPDPVGLIRQFTGHSPEQDNLDNISNTLNAFRNLRDYGNINDPNRKVELSLDNINEKDLFSDYAGGFLEGAVGALEFGSKAAMGNDKYRELGGGYIHKALGSLFGFAANTGNPNGEQYGVNNPMVSKSDYRQAAKLVSQLVGKNEDVRDNDMPENLAFLFGLLGDVTIGGFKVAGSASKYVMAAKEMKNANRIKLAEDIAKGVKTKEVFKGATKIAKGLNLDGRTTKWQKALDLTERIFANKVTKGAAGIIAKPIDKLSSLYTPEQFAKLSKPARYTLEMLNSMPQVSAEAAMTWAIASQMKDPTQTTEQLGDEIASGIVFHNAGNAFGQLAKGIGMKLSKVVQRYNAEPDNSKAMEMLKNIMGKDFIEQLSRQETMVNDIDKSKWLPILQNMENRFYFIGEALAGPVQEAANTIRKDGFEAQAWGEAWRDRAFNNLIQGVLFAMIPGSRKGSMNMTELLTKNKLRGMIKDAETWRTTKEILFANEQEMYQKQMDLHEAVKEQSKQEKTNSLYDLYEKYNSDLQYAKIKREESTEDQIIKKDIVIPDKIEDEDIEVQDNIEDLPSQTGEIIRTMSAPNDFFIEDDNSLPTKEPSINKVSAKEDIFITGLDDNVDDYKDDEVSKEVSEEVTKKVTKEVAKEVAKEKHEAKKEFKKVVQEDDKTVRWNLDDFIFMLQPTMIKQAAGGDGTIYDHIMMLDNKIDDIGGLRFKDMIGLVAGKTISNTILHELVHLADDYHVADEDYHAERVALHEEYEKVFGDTKQRIENRYNFMRNRPEYSNVSDSELFLKAQDKELREIEAESFAAAYGSDIELSNGDKMKTEDFIFNTLRGKNEDSDYGISKGIAQVVKNLIHRKGFSKKSDTVKKVSELRQLANKLMKESEKVSDPKLQVELAHKLRTVQYDLMNAFGDSLKAKNILKNHIEAIKNIGKVINPLSMKQKVEHVILSGRGLLDISPDDLIKKSTINNELQYSDNEANEEVKTKFENHRASLSVESASKMFGINSKTFRMRFKPNGKWNDLDTFYNDLTKYNSMLKNPYDSQALAKICMRIYGDMVSVEPSKSVAIKLDKNDKQLTLLSTEGASKLDLKGKQFTTTAARPVNLGFKKFKSFLKDVVTTRLSDKGYYNEEFNKTIDLISKSELYEGVRSIFYHPAKTREGMPVNQYTTNVAVDKDGRKVDVFPVSARDVEGNKTISYYYAAADAFSIDKEIYNTPDLEKLLYANDGTAMIAKESKDFRMLFPTVNSGDSGLGMINVTPLFQDLKDRGLYLGRGRFIDMDPKNPNINNIQSVLQSVADLEQGVISYYLMAEGRLEPTDYIIPTDVGDVNLLQYLTYTNKDGRFGADAPAEVEISGKKVKIKEKFSSKLVNEINELMNGKEGTLGLKDCGFIFNSHIEIGDNKINLSDLLNGVPLNKVFKEIKPSEIISSLDDWLRKKWIADIQGLQVIHLDPAMKVMDLYQKKGSGVGYVKDVLKYVKAVQRDQAFLPLSKSEAMLKKITFSDGQPIINEDGTLSNITGVEIAQSGLHKGELVANIWVFNDSMDDLVEDRVDPMTGQTLNISNKYFGKDGILRKILNKNIIDSGTFVMDPKVTELMLALSGYEYGFSVKNEFVNDDLHIKHAMHDFGPDTKPNREPIEDIFEEFGMLPELKEFQQFVKNNNIAMIVPKSALKIDKTYEGKEWEDVDRNTKYKLGGDGKKLKLFDGSRWSDITDEPLYDYGSLDPNIPLSSIENKLTHGLLKIPLTGNNGFTPMQRTATEVHKKDGVGPMLGQAFVEGANVIPDESARAFNKWITNITDRHSKSIEAMSMMMDCIINPDNWNFDRTNPNDIQFIIGRYLDDIRNELERDGDNNTVLSLEESSLKDIIDSIIGTAKNPTTGAVDYYIADKYSLKQLELFSNSLIAKHPGTESDILSNIKPTDRLKKILDNIAQRRTYGSGAVLVPDVTPMVHFARGITNDLHKWLTNYKSIDGSKQYATVSKMEIAEFFKKGYIQGLIKPVQEGEKLVENTIDYAPLRKALEDYKSNKDKVAQAEKDDKQQVLTNPDMKPKDFGKEYKRITAERNKVLSSYGLVDDKGGISLDGRILMELLNREMLNDDGTIVGINHETGYHNDNGIVVSQDMMDQFALKIGDKTFVQVMPTDNINSMLPMRVIGVFPSWQRCRIGYNSELSVGYQGKDHDNDHVTLIPYQSRIQLRDPRNHQLIRGTDWSNREDFNTFWDGLHKAGFHKGNFVNFNNAVTDTYKKLINFGNTIDKHIPNVGDVKIPDYRFNADRILAFDKENGDKLFNQYKQLRLKFLSEKDMEHYKVDTDNKLYEEFKDILNIPFNQDTVWGSNELNHKPFHNGYMSNKLRYLSETKIGLYADVATNNNAMVSWLIALKKQTTNGSIPKITIKIPIVKEGKRITHKGSSYEVSLHGVDYKDLDIQFEHNPVKIDFYQSLTKQAAVDLFVFNPFKLDPGYTIAKSFIKNFDDQHYTREEMHYIKNYVRGLVQDVKMGTGMLKKHNIDENMNYSKYVDIMQLPGKSVSNRSKGIVRALEELNAVRKHKVTASYRAESRKPVHTNIAGLESKIASAFDVDDYGDLEHNPIENIIRQKINDVVRNPRLDDYDNFAARYSAERDAVSYKLSNWIQDSFDELDEKGNPITYKLHQQEYHPLINLSINNALRTLVPSSNEYGNENLKIQRLNMPKDMRVNGKRKIVDTHIPTKAVLLGAIGELYADRSEVKGLVDMFGQPKRNSKGELCWTADNPMPLNLSMWGLGSNKAGDIYALQRKIGNQEQFMPGNYEFRNGNKVKFGLYAVDNGKEMAEVRLSMSYTDKKDSNLNRSVDVSLDDIFESNDADIYNFARHLGNQTSTRDDISPDEKNWFTREAFLTNLYGSMVYDYKNNEDLLGNIQQQVSANNRHRLAARVITHAIRETAKQLIRTPNQYKFDIQHEYAILNREDMTTQKRWKLYTELMAGSLLLSRPHPSVIMDDLERMIATNKNENLVNAANEFKKNIDKLSQPEGIKSSHRLNQEMIGNMDSGANAMSDLNYSKMFIDNNLGNQVYNSLKEMGIEPRIAQLIDNNVIDSLDGSNGYTLPQYVKGIMRADGYDDYPIPYRPETIITDENQYSNQDDYNTLKRNINRRLLINAIKNTSSWIAKAKGNDYTKYLDDLSKSLGNVDIKEFIGKDKETMKALTRTFLHDKFNEVFNVNHSDYESIKQAKADNPEEYERRSLLGMIDALSESIGDIYANENNSTIHNAMINNLMAYDLYDAYKEIKSVDMSKYKDMTKFQWIKSHFNPFQYNNPMRKLIQFGRQKVVYNNDYEILPGLTAGMLNVMANSDLVIRGTGASTHSLGFVHLAKAQHVETMIRGHISTMESLAEKVHEIGGFINKDAKKREQILRTERILSNYATELFKGLDLFPTADSYALKFETITADLEGLGKLGSNQVGNIVDKMLYRIYADQGTMKIINEIKNNEGVDDSDIKTATEIFLHHKLIFNGKMKGLTRQAIAFVEAIEKDANNPKNRMNIPLYSTIETLKKQLYKLEKYTNLQITNTNPETGELLGDKSPNRWGLEYLPILNTEESRHAMLIDASNLWIEKLKTGIPLTLEEIEHISETFDGEVEDYMKFATKNGANAFEINDLIGDIKEEVRLSEIRSDEIQKGKGGESFSNTLQMRTGTSLFYKRQHSFTYKGRNNFVPLLDQRSTSKYLSDFESNLLNLFSHAMELQYRQENEYHENNGMQENPFAQSEVLSRFSNMRGEDLVYGSQIPPKDIKTIECGTPVMIYQDNTWNTSGIVPESKPVTSKSPYVKGIFLKNEGNSNYIYDVNTNRVIQVSNAVVDKVFKGASESMLRNKIINNLQKTFGVIASSDKLKEVAWRDNENRADILKEMKSDIDNADRSPIKKALVSSYKAKVYMQYLGMNKLATAGIYTIGGLVSSLFAPGLGGLCLTMAAKNAMQFGKGMVQKISGNFISSGRFAAGMMGFDTINHINKEFRKAFVTYQDRIDSVNLNTFSDSILESMAISAKFGVWRHPIRHYLDTRNGLRKHEMYQNLYDRSQSGDINMAESLALANDIQERYGDIIETGTSESIKESIAKHYYISKHESGDRLMDAYGQTVSDMQDLRKRTKLEALKWMSTCFGLLPGSEEKSSLLAANFGDAFINKLGGGSYSKEQKQALLATMRHLSVGEYGLASRTGFSRTPLGKSMFLYSRFNEYNAKWHLNYIWDCVDRQMLSKHLSQILGQDLSSVIVKNYENKPTAVGTPDFARSANRMLKLGIATSMMSTIAMTGFTAMMGAIMPTNMVSIFNGIFGVDPDVTDSMESTIQQSGGNMVFREGLRNIMGLMLSQVAFDLKNDLLFEEALKKGAINKNDFISWANDLTNAPGDLMFSSGMSKDIASATNAFFSLCMNFGLYALANDKHSPTYHKALDEYFKKNKGAFFNNLFQSIPMVNVGYELVQPVISGVDAVTMYKEAKKKGDKKFESIPSTKHYLSKTIGKIIPPKTDSDNKQRIVDKQSIKEKQAIKQNVKF